VGWLEFISKVVGSLAWPTAAGVAAWRLKKPLTKLLKGRRLGAVKAGGFEATLTPVEKALDEAKESVTAIVTQPPLDDVEVEQRTDAERYATVDDQPLETGITTGRDDDSRLYEIAAVSPIGAVVSSFQRIEVALAESAVVLGHRDDFRASLNTNLVRLKSEGVLDDGDLNTIAQLQKIRDLALHTASEISASTANDFIQLTNFVLSRLARTAARSYEVVVLRALTRVTKWEVVVTLDRVMDAVVNSPDGGAVDIGTLYFKNTTMREALDWEPRPGANPLVLVSNSPFSARELSGVIPSVRTVFWRSPADDEELRSALESQMTQALQTKQSSGQPSS
jgi:hypothetical protein